MRLATRTLAAFESVTAADQGNRFRALLKDALIEATDIYKQDDGSFRTHLGASVIGRKCARQIWYSHRWVKNVQFSGRMIRLFNRGNIEEARCVALLRSIGCTVEVNDADGRQFKFSALNNHFGGSLDSIIYGIPDLPEEYVLGEFKTHNENSFVKVQQDGMQVAKPEHYAQMICYMDARHLKYGLYIAVHKETDEIHAEIIPADPAAARRYVERASLILDDRPPPRISTTPGWWECKFCDFKDVCFQNEAPAHNCRSCASSRVHTAEGTPGWTCITFSGLPINKDVQRLGCARWTENPKIRRLP